MSFEVMTGSSYREVMKQDQKIPNISLNEQIPNIRLNEQVPNIQSSDKPTSAAGQKNEQSGSNLGNEKRNNSNSEEQIKSVINKANNQLKFTGTRCEFTYFDDINRVAIKVIDKDTDEIIREIPPEETLELLQKFLEFTGLIYDKKG